MVQRVGIILGLQRDAGVLAVEHAALALIVQEITGVELDTGTVRVNCHAPPGYGIAQLSAGVAEHLVVVIIAALELQAFVVRVQIPGDGLGDPEVHGSALHAAQFAGGNGLGVIGVEETGGQRQHLIHGGIGVLVAPEVEVAVIGHVEYGVLIADRVIADVQAAFGIQTVGDANLGVAGEALIAVGTAQFQRDGGVGVGNQFPHSLEIEIGAGMEVVAVFVGGQGIVFAVQAEGRTLNAVGVAAYCGAQTAAAHGVADTVVAAQNNVSQVTLFVGNQQGNQGGAVVGDVSGDAATRYCVQAGFLTGWQNAKIFFHGNCSFHFS